MVCRQRNHRSRKTGDRRHASWHSLSNSRPTLATKNRMKTIREAGRRPLSAPLVAPIPSSKRSHRAFVAGRPCGGRNWKKKPRHAHNSRTDEGPPSRASLTSFIQTALQTHMHMGRPMWSHAAAAAGSAVPGWCWRGRVRCSHRRCGCRDQRALQFHGGRNRAPAARSGRDPPDWPGRATKPSRPASRLRGCTPV